MNPLWLHARNYRTFEELDLDLPAGCCAVVGDNGAGKSSIINIIDLALFGPPGRSLADYLTDDGADTELELELVFEHAGGTYRARRGYSARGRGKTTLDLERLEEHEYRREGFGDQDPDDGARATGWMPLTREDIKATQAAIEELLGLSRETFRASAFLAQGDGAAFTEAQPRDRKRILAEVLGLDRWEQMLACARHDKRIAEDEVTKISARLEQADAELARQADVERELHEADLMVTAATEDVAAAEKRAGELAERHRQMERQRAELVAVAGERDRAEDRLRALEERQREAREAARLIEIANDELVTLPTSAQIAALEQREGELVQKIEAYRALVQRRDVALREYDLRLSQRNAILGQASELNEKAHALREQADALEQRGPGESSCERCGQTLGAEALASSVASMRREADDLDAAAADLDTQASQVTLPDVPEEPEPLIDEPIQIVGVQQRLREAREAAVTEARLRERIRAFGEKVTAGTGDTFEGELAAADVTYAQLESKVSALEEGCPTADDVERIERDQAQVQQQIDTLRQRLQEATATKVRAEAALERLRAIADQVDETRRERERHLEELDLLATLERAYGRNGIPALIVEAVAIPAIETEASRILAELGTSYRVELRTQRALKSGDGLADTLDVVVIGEAGERPYETFSGGERTRINLALRIALARLLAHRRGAESKLLAIDEPEFLDEAGVARLADVLRGLSGDFERVYLISHVSGLRDAFDVTLEVVKDGSRSRVVEGDGGAGVIEAVA